MLRSKSYLGVGMFFCLVGCDAALGPAQQHRLRSAIVPVKANAEADPVLVRGPTTLAYCESVLMFIAANAEGFREHGIDPDSLRSRFLAMQVERNGEIVGVCP
jgi:hypothetical protein